MNRRNKFLSLISTIALALTVALAIGAKSKDDDTSSLEGKAAPDFSFKTLDGNTVKLSEQKGSVVLMDYWATWCPPCRKGLPHIAELANDKDLAAKGLKVWAINSKETADKVKPFLEKNKLSFTVPMDADGEFGKSYMVQGIPTTVVVGRDGVIKKVFIGFGPDSATEIKKAVEEALKDTKTS